MKINYFCKIPTRYFNIEWNIFQLFSFLLQVSAFYMQFKYYQRLQFRYSKINLMHLQIIFAKMKSPIINQEQITYIFVSNILYIFRIVLFSA